MKKSIFLLLICFCYFISSAQNGPLVKKTNKGLSLTHTVSPKENFYSIGRLYNVPAKEIASFNGLEMTHGLTIGQVVHVPLTKANFTQAKPTSKPVYYEVGQKEGLFRVSANNNNVLMASLRKWNNLTSDNIAPGQKLIVGFLTDGVAVNTTAVAETKPAVAEKKPAEQPKPVVTEEPKKPVEEKPVVIAEEKKHEEVVSIEEKPVAKPEPVKTVSNPITSEPTSSYFRSQFDMQTKVQPLSYDQTITAGIFKTASGWEDHKYYALIDNVESGTIIKIINPNNNKAIYAKVLDRMSGIRQNQGFDLRMSNAAAVALDIADSDKFFVRVVY